MLTLRRCWHWKAISLILSMLTQHHGNGFAGKRRAWLRYGTPSTGYIGGKSRLMCEMNQCWGSSEALAMQLQCDNTGIVCWCMEMLAFGSHAILATWKEDAWVVLFLWGVRLRAEGKGAAFHHFTYPLGASVVVVFVWFCLGVFCFLLFFCLLGLRLGFLHGVCLEPIGLLLQ